MTTDPNLPERAYQAGRAGTDPPEGYGEAEKRVVAGFYRAGLRDAGRDAPEPDPVEEWQQREGRIIDDCKRAMYGTPGPEQRPIEADGPHDPGG